MIERPKTSHENPTKKSDTQIFDSNIEEYEGCDPKIRELVKSINLLGVKTFWSCEGHSDGRLTGSHVPAIAITTKDSLKEGLDKLFELIGIFNFNRRDHISIGAWVFVPHETYLLLQFRNETGELAEIHLEAKQLGEFISKQTNRI
ncbi:MAG: hypothetical protein WC884_01030 [Candidatus Paceibacterota bacterium]